MKKLTKQQKKAIKDKLFKILHVICYVLSVAFVGLMIITGVQSCNKRDVGHVNTQSVLNKRMQDVTYVTQDYVAYTQNDSLTRQTYAVVESFQTFYELPSATDVNTYMLDLNINGIIHYDNSDIAFNALQLLFTRYDDEYAESVFLRLESVWVYIDVSTQYLILDWDGQTGNYYDFYYNGDYWLETSQNNDLFLNTFYDVSAIKDFVFNKDFNFNAPINLTLNMYYGSLTTIAAHIGDNLYRITYDVGLFSSNGTYYDKIVFDYFNAGSCDYLINNTLTRGTDGTLSYFGMGYHRLDNTGFDFINYRDTSQYLPVGSSSQPTTYYLNSSTFLNDSYRYITFYNLSAANEIKVNALNNNNQNANTGYVGSADVTDVFSLVASAFTAIIPVMSISVLPGISLGLLLFTPLVAMLVFAIIKIIKK